ncbi:hypothetical protein BC831DRAFT_6180 [Entophlyctis helioformis]|nr:hypothetical protein BC831DRAFT_6180 [Entophlyctis helioformis]
MTKAGSLIVAGTQQQQQQQAAAGPLTILHYRISAETTPGTPTSCLLRVYCGGCCSASCSCCSVIASTSTPVLLNLTVYVSPICVSSITLPDRSRPLLPLLPSSDWPSTLTLPVVCVDSLLSSSSSSSATSSGPGSVVGRSKMSDAHDELQQPGRVAR